MTRIIFLVTLIFCISCEKENENLIPETTQQTEEVNVPNSMSKFSLNHSRMTSENIGVEKILKVVTNINWKVISKPSWISLSKSSGNVDTEIAVTFLENTTPDLRKSSIIFSALDKEYVVDLEQYGFPLELIDFSGKEEPLKMDESLFLLFNKPIRFNSISSGEEYSSFFISEEEIEYFNNFHGIKYTSGSKKIGSEFNYKYSVERRNASPKEVLNGEIEISFYSKKINIEGIIKQIILDEEGFLWVLSFKPINEQTSSYIIKYRKSEDEFVEDLRFEVDIDNIDSDYIGGSFSINPYNNLIYIPDYSDDEVEVYTKEGNLIKKIKVDRVSSDHPQNPHSSPVFIAFTKLGKGIITLQGKGISGRKWRFIDSTNDDIIQQPESTHPYFYSDLDTFIHNNDKSKLYAIDGRSPVVKVFENQTVFGEINMNSFYPTGADAFHISQHRLKDKIYVMGLYNQQIVTPNGSYTSKQSFQQSMLGDFSYSNNHENFIYTLDDDYFKLLDYDNAETVFSYPLMSGLRWTNARTIITTPDDKLIIMFSATPKYGNNSELIFFQTEMFN